MIKAIRDLRDQKNTLAEAAQASIDARDFKKAKELKDQIAEINDQIATVEALEEEKRRNPVKEPVVGTEKPEPAKKSAEERIKEIRGSNEYMVDFAKAMARRVTVADVLRSEEFGALKAVLTETGGDPVGSDGGFLVPLDFDKMVWEIKKTLVPLSGYVTVENVNVPSGWRAVEKQAASQGFVKFDENTDIPDSEEPGFVKITFQLEDYGGLLPISNDLLSDTPINLLNYISRWYARKTVLTENSLILSALKAVTPIAFDKTKGISSLKTVLNKTLLTAHSAAAVIITNQSGFDYLDQLLDLDDRPLLQPDPTNATAYKALAKPVVVIDDDQCVNIAGTGADEGKTFAPIIVGDYLLLALIEGIVGALPQLIQAVIDMIPKIVKAIVDNLPKLVQAGIKIIVAVLQGIVENLPTVIWEFIKMIPGIVVALADGAWQLIKAGGEIIWSLIKGVGEAAWNLIKSAGDLAWQFIQGLWEGIKSTANWLWDKIKGFFSGIIDGIKEFLGIHSPSTLMAGFGENMALGLGDGFTKSLAAVSKDMLSSLADETGKLQASAAISLVPGGVAMGASALTNNYNMNYTINSPAALSLREIRQEMLLAQQRQALLRG